MTSFHTRLIGIMDEWAAQNGTSVIDVDAASDYALQSNQYNRLPLTRKQQCMRDMRSALQAAIYIDAQGHKVRAKHAVRQYVDQQIDLPITVYVDPRTAKPDLMTEAFNQSWEGIKNDVRRHSIEKESYDLNNPYEATLPLFDYDFNQVAKDAKMTGEYDDSYDPEAGDGLD